MTSRKAPIEATETRLGWRWLRLWGWLPLAVAAVVFVLKFTPGFYLATMDTETVVLPVFYQDIIEHHHSASTWGWGGFSALFPDIVVFFWLNHFSHDGQLALKLMLIVFFFGWLAGTGALMAVLKRPHKLGLAAMLLLLWVGLVFNFGIPNDWGMAIVRSLLQPIYHTGTGVLSLICLVFLLDQIANGLGIGFWWLFVLAFLGGVSDILIDVVFTGPALAAVTLMTIAFRKDWKRYLALAANLIVAAVAAYVLTPYIFPPALGTSGYLQFASDRAWGAYGNLMSELFNDRHRLFALVMVLDILTVLGGIGGFLFFCFSSRRKYISATVFSLMIFCSCSIFCNWASAILTGNYVDINANRYTTVAIMIPLFILVFGLHAAILWRPWLENLLAVAVAAFVVTVSFIPQTPTINYDCTVDDIPYMKKLMKDRHIDQSLANYWSANIVTFLSNGEVPVRSLTNTGQIYKWFNNLEWFGKGHPVKEWPHFRMIYYPDDGYRQIFGDPDEILATPRGSPIWIYSEAHSIRYSEYFDVLSSSLSEDGKTVRMNAAALPGGVSVILGNSRLAEDGYEEGWFQFGPYIVLEPARYRVTYRYTYFTLPADGKSLSFDILKHKGDKEESLDLQPIPCPDTTPQVFTDEFTVTEPNCVYEVRLFYHGSGTIRVDSIDLTYLGQ